MYNMEQIPSIQFAATENVRRILRNKIIYNADIYVIDTSNIITSYNVATRFDQLYGHTEAISAHKTKIIIANFSFGSQYNLSPFYNACLYKILFTRISSRCILL